GRHLSSPGDDANYSRRGTGPAGGARPRGGSTRGGARPGAGPRRPACRSPGGGSGQPVAGGVGLVGAREAEGSPQGAGAGRRPRQGEPAAVDLVGPGRVDHHVTVAVVGAGPLDADLLVPAVLAADGIGLDGEREVLVDSRILPEDPLG